MSTTTARRQPRSKGCKQCISRRVKCDERAECCKQCARFGLSCSGATRGAVFLDMTEKVSCSIARPRKRRSKRETNAKKTAEEQVEELAHADGTAKQQGGAEESNCLANPPSQFELTTEQEAATSNFCLPGIENSGETSPSSMIYQLGTESPIYLDDDQFTSSEAFSYDVSIPLALATSAYDEYCFVSNFTQLLASSRRNYSTLRPQSWIPKLPELVATNSLPSPLKYALHAVALLYHAVTRHDTRTEVPAVRLYLAGIESYRSMLLGHQAKRTLMASEEEEEEEEDQGSEAPRVSNIVAICVPILFSFYEALRDTGSDAELLHHSAATKMLEARGPEKCAVGLAHTVMRSMRVKEAFHSIMQNRLASFSSPEWLSIPFQQKHKICYDRLIDILLSFTKMLHLPNINECGATLKTSIRRIHDLPTARKDDIEEKAMILQAQLRKWWLDFKEEHYGIMTLNSEIPSAPEAAYAAAASPSSVLPLSGPWMIANRETLASSLVSIYSATHIILHTILFIISLSRPPNSIGSDGQSAVDAHQAAISAHAASVFHASLYLDMINPFCGDAVRARFSIIIVAQFALKDSQRDEAQRMLRQWKLRGRESPHCFQDMAS